MIKRREELEEAERLNLVAQAKKKLKVTHMLETLCLEDKSVKNWAMS